METIQFVKNPVMTDYFWQILVQKQGCHVAALLLDQLGYEGEFKNQQTCFKRFLKRKQELSSFDPQLKFYHLFRKK